MKKSLDYINQASRKDHSVDSLISKNKHSEEAIPSWCA